MAESALGRYLFAVARGLDADALGGVRGLRGRGVELIEHRGLQAVVCTVELEEFGEESLPQRLEDLGWLEEVARAHNDVVWAAAADATVAPMRLVTICSDDDSVRQRVDDHAEGLTRVLDSVEGRREWSVKAYAVPGAAAAPAPVQRAVPGEGAAYLERKRDQAASRRAAADETSVLAQEIYDGLGSQAVAARRLTPQDPRLTGRTEPMILNAAFLVPADAGETFRQAVQALQERIGAATLEAEGPWPPYSFAVLEDL